MSVCLTVYIQHVVLNAAVSVYLTLHYVERLTLYKEFSFPQCMCVYVRVRMYVWLTEFTVELP